MFGCCIAAGRVKNDYILYSLYNHMICMTGFLLPTATTGFSPHSGKKWVSLKDGIPTNLVTKTRKSRDKTTREKRVPKSGKTTGKGCY